MTDLAITIPVLASLDLAETRDFYTAGLGFAAIYQDDRYLIVRRDAMELHFWLTDDRRFPENTSCYIRGGQIDRLYEEFRTAGIERLSTLELRPWDMVEFHIHDPHGNLLRFGRNPEAE